MQSTINSAIKELIHATIWMKLESILLNEKKKPDTKKKYILCYFIYMNYPEKANPYRQKADRKLPVAGGKGAGEE